MLRGVLPHLFNHFLYSLKDSLGIFHHLIVPEPYNVDTIPFQEYRTLIIIDLYVFLRVSSAVNFYR